MPRRPPPTKRPAHSRLQTYIPGHLHEQIDLFCVERNWHESTFFETASARLIEGVGDKEMLYRRMDSLKRQVARLERTLDVSLRMMSHFVQLWFAHTPPLPQSDQKSSHRRSSAAYEEFIGRIARDLASGRTFVDDLPKDSLSPATDDIDEAIERPREAAMPRQPSKATPEPRAPMPRLDTRT